MIPHPDHDTLIDADELDAVEARNPAAAAMAARVLKFWKEKEAAALEELQCYEAAADRARRDLALARWAAAAAAAVAQPGPPAAPANTPGAAGTGELAPEGAAAS